MAQDEFTHQLKFATMRLTENSEDKLIIVPVKVFATKPLAAAKRAAVDFIRMEYPGTSVTWIGLMDHVTEYPGARTIVVQ